ncbi:MAG: enoyl-CoA hydratase/isomerase family protein [Caulobacter sp.]|nr:enoyl-CoA hydratase/isomerase family protein [Caulobacter sp.]
MTDHVLKTVEGGVMTLSFNRADKKNAITDAMYKVLADGLEEAEADPAIRAVLFRSETDSFTAGNDLADFAAQNASGDTSREAGLQRNVTRFLKALAAAEKPLVAAVRGVAVGVGTTMLLHCDLVYVADDARLMTPFVNLALVPEAASSWLLPARIGHARAYAMFALGEPVSGAEAATIGLANKALPSAEVDAAALAAARQVATKPMGSLKITKQLMRDAGRIADLMDLEGRHFGARLQTAEAAEAFAAFAQRRPADFSKIA